ncbi:MAG: glucose 1-dehydrogenase [Nitrospinota bacterium]
MRLKDKTAIVTGGGGGIGRGIIRAFAREGARVCVMDITEEVARRGAAEGGKDAFALGVDVTKEADVARAVKAAIERLGRVDILVNCHGRPSRLMANPIDRLTLEEWNEVFAVNTAGVFLMCRALAPHMRERRYGKIINIASLAARRANENVPHYCAAKAATMSLTMSLAKEMAKHGVNVNAINPGMLWTEFWEKGHGVIIGLDTDKAPREVFDAFVKAAVPFGREQTPDDVGDMAVFLASDESRNVTGQGLQVDGGAWMV